MIKKVVLSTALLTSSLLASNYKYEVSPVIGFNIPEGNIGVKNYPFAGVKLQLNTLLLEDLKPEFSLLYAKAKYDKTALEGQKSDIYRVAAALVHEFDERGYYVPYLRGGAGYESWSENAGSGNHDSVYGEIGGGVKVLLTKRWVLRAEADYLLKDNSTRMDSNAMILIGACYSFGDVKGAVRVIESGYVAPKEQKKIEPKEEKPVFLDSDEDGVLDSKDRCPHTPAGVKIDAFGCELDSDGDGVVDSKDSCPATQKGVKVDENGCAIDKDGDGVLNVVDQCPDTPKGVDVDENGCTIKMIAALIDGRKKNTAIVVSTKAGSVVVDKPGEATVITDASMPPSQPKKLSKSEMEHFFGPVASSAETVAPRKFVLYFNGLQIIPSSQAQLQQLLELVKERKGEYIEISGYTDTVGKTQFNYQLGLKRARKVAGMIAKADKDALKVVVKSYGESALAVPTGDNVQEDRNKRVEVFVY